MDLSAKTLIIIAGPTAVGKSSLAMEVAQRLSCPILSADSRQIYREMTIGTAKPTQADLERVPHHFINELSVTDAYSAGQYEREAIERLTEIYQEHDYAVMCGGTGLYIRAVREGLDTFPQISPEIIQTVTEEYNRLGLPHLQDEIAALDPRYAEQVDMNNSRRLIRAIAVARQSGIPYSDHLRGQATQRPWREVAILLAMDRPLLHQRIHQRVDMMMEAGLLTEVRGLQAYRSRRPLETVGYQELLDHLEGTITLDQAIDLIKTHTRQYAKRQMTWFRKYGTWEVLRDLSMDAQLAMISQHISS